METGQERCEEARSTRKVGAQERKLSSVVRQRREREKQALKQAILQAARDIAVCEGWQAVTIRKVAERIEYSPPTIYEYFEGKDDILNELLQEGFQQLAAAIRLVMVGTEDAETLLLQMAEAYWDFAFQHAELYQVMHGLNGAPCTNKPPEQRETFLLIQDTMSAWIQSTGVNAPDLFGAVEIIRSTIHGLISLTMTDRIFGGEPRARELMQRAMRDLLRGWSCNERS